MARVKRFGRVDNTFYSATAIRDEWADEKIHQELVDKCEFSISNGTKSFNKASFGIIMLLTLVLLIM